jgi:DNA-binding NtrC family response regulator
VGVSEPRGRVLIVDGDAEARRGLADALTDAGYAVETAADGFRALAKLPDVAPDAIVCELHMPGVDGLALLARARTDDPERVVILTSSDHSVETAVEAMRQGASDYLPRPVRGAELLMVINRALERRQRQRTHGAQRLRAEPGGAARVGGIVSHDPALQSIFRSIQQIAPSAASVLLTGESGTGKGLVARAIHDASPRAAAPFVKLHCAALAETLLESELFGHERGAFTGALARRDGRIQQADGGTLFLDEIGEISPAVQVKLLRFLQERELERVGGNQTIHVDVRIIAATNRDLAAEIAAGRFREDLFYRLNVVAIEMPPLRARPADIPILANHILRRLATASCKDVRGFSAAAMDALLAHRWPGNVRELENAIERAVVTAAGPIVQPEHLPASVTAAAATAAARVGTATAMPTIPGATLAEMECFLILKTLEHTGGCKAHAANILGVSYRKIQYKLREYEAEARRIRRTPAT